MLPSGWGTKTICLAQRQEQSTRFTLRFAQRATAALLTVIAKLQPEDGFRFPWGTWYHELAPEGDFKQVPGNYRQLGVARGFAEAMIDLIKLGRPFLPVRRRVADHRMS